MSSIAYRQPQDDCPTWLVADRDGQILASRLCLRQLRARVEHGLLRNAAWVAHEHDGAWRPLGELLSSTEAQWYLMREGSAVVGPVSTETVRRGIEAGRVPLDTYVCAAGQPTWRPIDEQSEFIDLFEDVLATVARSGWSLPRFAVAS